MNHLGLLTLLHDHVIRRAGTHRPPLRIRAESSHDVINNWIAVQIVAWLTARRGRQHVLPVGGEGFEPGITSAEFTVQIGEQGGITPHTVNARISGGQLNLTITRVADRQIVFRALGVRFTPGDFVQGNSPIVPNAHWQRSSGRYFEVETLPTTTTAANRNPRLPHF